MAPPFSFKKKKSKENASVVDSVHLNSFHPVSSLYVFPPNPPASSYTGNVLSPTMVPLRTRGPSGVSIFKTKREDSYDYFIHSSKLETMSLASMSSGSASIASTIKNEIKPPLPRLRFGISSCIHPQCGDPRRGGSFLSELASPTERHENGYNGIEVTAHKQYNEKVTPWATPLSCPRRKSGRVLEHAQLPLLSSPPHRPLPTPPLTTPSQVPVPPSSCHVLFSFHPSTPDGSTPSQHSQTCHPTSQWKPYYLSFRSHSISPIMHLHSEPTLCDVPLSTPPTSTLKIASKNDLESELALLHLELKRVQNLQNRA